MWLERCRDGSYAVNALHNVGSLCMHCGVHCCLFHWFLGKCFLVEVHLVIMYIVGFPSIDVGSTDKSLWEASTWVFK